MQPLNARGSSLGTTHLSTGLRASTTQQAPRAMPPCNHHCVRYRPPVGSPDDVCGDIPPPYTSLFPPGSVVTKPTNADNHIAITDSRRHINSESCVSPCHHHDNELLAELAALQLLNGCMPYPGRQIRGICSCRGVAYSNNTHIPDDLNLHVAPEGPSKIHDLPSTMPFDARIVRNSGTDGHMSLDSTKPVRMRAQSCSTSRARSFSREHFPSEDLDRRLESIDKSLSQDKSQCGRPNNRLHTSEVSRRQQSLTVDDAVDANQSCQEYNYNKSGGVSVKNLPHGFSGTLRDFQHKDHSGHSHVLFPSTDCRETHSPCEVSPEVCRCI